MIATLSFDPQVANFIPLAAGEALMVNNTTCLHGRRPYLDAPDAARELVRAWIQVNPTA